MTCKPLIQAVWAAVCRATWAVSPELIVVVIRAPATNPVPCPLLSMMDCANSGPKSLFERFLYKREEPDGWAFSAVAQRLGMCFLHSILS